MPSFSIEAEGETNPLSRQSVITVLANASRGYASQQALQVATQQVGNWEKTAGYYALLQDIYSDFSQDQAIRHQAIIQLKNGIDKHWRKTTTHPIAKNEKEQIRSRSITAGVNEPVPALALQNSLMLAKIVRYEFPHDWPDVITTIIQQLRNVTQDPATTAAQVSNILVITLHVIKELASGRLQRTKKSLQQVASELLQVLGQLYVNLVARWGQSQSNLESAQNSYLALKTLRRLLVAGFENPHREQDVKQFWNVLQADQQNFLAQYNQNQSEQIRLILMKHLLQLSKLHLEMARSHPASFVMLGCMDILNRAWDIVSRTDAKAQIDARVDWDVYRSGDNIEEEAPTEKLALKALLLFRACLKMVFNPVQTFKYQTPQDKEDRKLAVDEIKSSVLTNDFVTRLMEILVTRYFVLRPADLRDWEQEPDEWERREEEIADAWEFSVRSCSEKLFLDLVINFKELLVPQLLQVFQQYATTTNTNVLLKDSLYSAIGIAAACTEDVLDFNSFLRNTLVPEVQMQQPNYNLLRRRTAILLGQWVPIKPEVIDRVAVYQIFTHLLSSGERLNDHVVRVTAGRQLRLVLEPFEFKYQDFEPYAHPLLSSLMSLIAETDLSETKMALLETVRVAVTKLEGEIEPYAQGIMSTLPPLWSESGEEHLMKQAILTMITAIINSLGPKSLSYHPSILPIIHGSIQPDSEAIVYLLEDALDLWAAVLAQTPTASASPELLALCSSLLPLLQYGSEHLRQIFELIESYSILSPATVLDAGFLTPVLTLLKELLPILSSSAHPRDTSLAPHVVENLIATLALDPPIGQAQQSEALSHLLSTMLSTGYLNSLLSLLHEAHKYHLNPRPNIPIPNIIGPPATSLFTLLSRLILLSPDMFVEAVNATNLTSTDESRPPKTQSPIEWLLTEWLLTIENTSDILRKKLQALALTHLLTANNAVLNFLLENLQSLMTIWTDVATELALEAPDDSQGDYLWQGRDASDLPEWPDATPEDARKRSLSNRDQIYTVNIRVWIAERLCAVIERVGGPEAFERDCLSRLDGAVVKAFADLKIL